MTDGQHFIFLQILALVTDKLVTHFLIGALILISGQKMEVTVFILQLSMDIYIFVNGKFDIHTADKNGWRAIHLSAKNGSYELIKYFVDNGTYIHFTINDGKNSLHIAA